MSVLIKNGTLVLADKTKKADLMIEGGTIEKIAARIAAKNAKKVIDAKGTYVFPGAIDPHVHLELDLGTGRMSSDTFASGSAAALQGGVTTMFTFAHQESKEETLLDAYKRRKKLAKKAKNRVLFHSGIMNRTYDMERQIRAAAAEGLKSFKIYNNNLAVTTEFLYRALRTIAQVGGTAMVHCEDGRIVEYLKRGLHRRGKRACSFVPASRPWYLEYHSIVSTAILAEQFKASLYIAHVSTRAGAEYIAQAQERGVDITGETCPHYLLLTDQLYRRQDGYLYTCTPPFRRKDDNEALWQAVKEGSIGMISTDHCPFWRKQKIAFGDSFINYVYGLPGVEISPLLMLSEMRRRKFTYPKISRLLTVNAAKYFGLYPAVGALEPGAAADLFIYNPRGEQRLSCKNWHMQSDFNQFEGWKVKGNIDTVIYKGKEVKRP